MGFRSGAGVLAWLAVAGILILFTLALTWLAVIAGLSAKTVDGASAFSYPLIFLPFVSSAFVPTDSMPGPVRAFAEHQPVTSIVDAIRDLFAQQPVGTDIWIALAWCVGILVSRTPSRWPPTAARSPDDHPSAFVAARSGPLAALRVDRGDPDGDRGPGLAAELEEGVRRVVRDEHHRTTRVVGDRQVVEALVSDRGRQRLLQRIDVGREGPGADPGHLDDTHVAEQLGRRTAHRTTSAPPAQRRRRRRAWRRTSQ